MNNKQLTRKEKIAILNGIATGQCSIQEIKELGPPVITDMIVIDGNWRMSMKQRREWTVDDNGNEIPVNLKNK